MTENETLELGFLQESEPWALTNRYFPSKVGGKPAWLDLENIPSNQEMKCSSCNKTIIFLCQVYAPVEDDVNCFHRTIFLFLCKTPECYETNFTQNIIAFRNQLPRENKFYPFDPPDECLKLSEIQSPISLCSLCGCRGPFKCAKCKSIAYCGIEHQTIDWKRGHKEECNNKNVISKNTSFLFSEFELLIGDNEENVDNHEEINNSVEYNKYLESPNANAFKDTSDSELSQYCNGKEDEVFRKFTKNYTGNSKQVMRYDRGGNPLWISSECILNNDNIPKCENCGAKRIFEFQIMPQMLYFLKELEIDWGVINVYTCEKNCATESIYRKEFAYKQNITN